MGAAVREVVPRRQAERLLQLRRSPRRGRQRRQGRVLLGRRAGGRATHDHVRRPAARGRALRERAEGARRQEGDAGRDLHGHGSGAADRDARVRAARSAAHGRVRRLLGGVAVGSHERHGVRAPDHAGRGLARRQEGAAQAERRRGRGAGADREESRRAAANRRRRSVRRVTRLLVARAHRGTGRRSGLGAARADGRRGSALSPLHVGDDREAEGDRAHDRRLPRRRRVDAPLHLRHQARLRLLVRGRRRLGHRAQLHRLRPAHERDDRRHVRGRAELSEPGTLVGDRRALQGRHPLHGADGDPLAHEVGAGARRRSTTSRRCACSAASASRSIRRRGSGTASTSAATALRSWTRGGRRRRA